MGVLPVSAVEGKAGCAVAMLPLDTADPPLVNETYQQPNKQLNTTFRQCPWKLVLLYLCHHR